MFTPVSILRWELSSSSIAQGEELYFTVELKNNASSTQSVLLWLEAYLPNGDPFVGNPLSTIPLHLDPHQILKKRANLCVPSRVRPRRYLLRLAVGSALNDTWDGQTLELAVVPGAKSRQNVCNLCGNRIDDSRIVWCQDGLSLAKCPSCGLVFDFDVLQYMQLEEEDGWRLDVSSLDYGVYRGIEPYFDKANQLVLAAEIERISNECSLPCRKLLDFGCGIGNLLLQARLQGFEIYGVEANRAAIDYVRSNHLFPIFSTMDKLAGEVGSAFFDVVVVRHALEHVSNPTRVLKGLHKLLRTDGLIVVIVPCFNLLTRRLLPNTMRLFSWKLIFKGHQFYYTQETLREYLRRLGFGEIQYKPLIFGGFAMRQLGNRLSVGSNRKVIEALYAVSTILHMIGVEPVLTAYAKKQEAGPR